MGFHRQVLESYLKLRGKTTDDLCKLLDITRQGLYLKLSGRSSWSTADMQAIRDFLEMSPEGFTACFAGTEEEVERLEIR